MDCRRRSWVTRVRASGTKHLFCRLTKAATVQFVSDQVVPRMAACEAPLARVPLTVYVTVKKVSWVRCNWRVWSLLHTHRSIMPLSWQRRWVTARGRSFPARTRRHRLAHRPTVLAHFCGTSLCPHRHLDVFFFVPRRFVFSLVVCVKILLSALRPLSGRRVSTGGADTETLTLFIMAR